MAAAIIGLIASLAYTGYQVAQSEKQKKQARAAAKQPRPTRDTPAAMKEMVNKARFNAGKFGVPGQGQLQSQMDRNVAGQVRNIKEMGISPVAMAGAFGQTQQLQNESQERLAIAGAQTKERNEGIYMNSLQQLAMEENANWDWNAKQKYLDAMAAASALRNAAALNQEKAVYGGINAVSQYAQISGGGGGGTNRTYPAGVDPNYRAPQRSPQLMGYSGAPGADIQKQSAMDRGMGPVRYDPYSDDAQAYKQQFMQVYGRMPTDEEAMQYYNLMERY